jgi:hypothetical protein
MAGIEMLPCFFGGGGTTHGHRFFQCIIRRGVGRTNGGRFLRVTVLQEQGENGALQLGAIRHAVGIVVRLDFGFREHSRFVLVDVRGDRFRRAKGCERRVERVFGPGEGAGVAQSGGFEFEDVAGGGASGGAGRIGEVGAQNSDGSENSFGPFDAALSGGEEHDRTPGEAKRDGKIMYTI